MIVDIGRGSFRSSRLRSRPSAGVAAPRRRPRSLYGGMAKAGRPGRPVMFAVMLPPVNPDVFRCLDGWPASAIRQAKPEVRCPERPLDVLGMA